MAKLFYEGNKETLQFKAEDKRGTLKPYHSFVSIFNDEEQLVFDAPVQINDNELSFAIPDDIMGKSDDYVAVFTIDFTPQIRRNHAIRFAVVPREVPEEFKFEPVADLTDESTPDEIETAVGHTLRHLRRGGAAVYDKVKDFRRATNRVVMSRTGKKLEY